MSKKNRRKVILIVLDSAGCGNAPDAADYGDAGSNTYGRIAKAMPELELANLNALGLGRLVPEFAARKKNRVDRPVFAAKLQEASRGKDTITGHWELGGVLTEEPFPTFPDGFPEELLDAVYEKTGCRFLGNEVASGTEIIQRLGDRHLETKQPILYTSADSVIQIAAHEDLYPVEELYRICEAARELTRTGPYKVGRVIARPFIGTSGNYTRTANRHDYALPTPKPNLLDDVLKSGQAVLGVGKIMDIFAGTAFTRAEHTKSNAHGMQMTLDYYQDMENGLLFTNLVDFDMKYGHRRDITGYGTALKEFDDFLDTLLSVLDDDTVLAVTADHGCDPGYAGTDHTREQVPILLYGAQVKDNTNETEVPVYPTFSDLAATVAEYLEVPYHGHGTSFYKEAFR